MKTRLTLAAFLAALGLLGAGCAGSGQVAAPPPPSPESAKGKSASRALQTNPLDDPASPRRIVYAPGLVSDPLPRGQRVGVSRADIEKRAGQRTFGPALQPGAPEVALRLVTLGAGGTGSPASPRPSWVLTWKGSQPDIKGGAQLTEKERRALAARLSCVFVVVVDADTGADTDARQLCAAKGS